MCFMFLYFEEHTTYRLRKADGFFREQSSGFWKICWNCRYHKYFTRFGIAIASSWTSYTTNGKSINPPMTVRKLFMNRVNHYYIHSTLGPPTITGIQ